MSEIDQFIEYNKGKSVKTISTYERLYKKLSTILNSDVSHVSQDKIIKLINDNIDNINTIQSLLNVAILVRKMKELNTDILYKEKKNNIEKVNKHTKEINEEKKDELPSLKDLYEYTDFLYENKLWSDYIINYLLLNYYVRNEDINFLIKLKKKDTIDKNYNYMWYDKRNKKVLYIRNNYKTSYAHGTKQHTIVDSKFVNAIKNLINERKNKDEKEKFIMNEDGIGYYIMKATYKGIGEGNYLKIIIFDNIKNENPHILKEISESRGTNVDTLITNYTL